MKVSFIGRAQVRKDFDTQNAERLRWTEQGFEYEAGMRHVDIMMAELRLQDAKGVKTLFAMSKKLEMMETETLDKFDSKRFRALSSRANFWRPIAGTSNTYSVKLCAEECHNQQTAEKTRHADNISDTGTKSVWIFGWQEDTPCREQRLGLARVQTQVTSCQMFVPEVTLRSQCVNCVIECQTPRGRTWWD